MSSSRGNIALRSRRTCRWKPTASSPTGREDGLTIYASTQFTASVRDEAAEHFNLPKNKVRVISDFTGGGFGAKYGIGNYGLLAINLSRKAGAPVRLMLDRREEHVAGGNRPSSLQRLKIGARTMGR